MNNPLYLFVGRSASGKTTIANILADKYDYKQVESFTTRQPRFDNEPGHVFVTEDEFNNLGELAAYTFYNGNHYGTTFKQLDECSIYVVDVPGVESLLYKYQDSDRKICIIYFDASVYTRIHRMIDRGDSDNAIVCRLVQDEKDDWFSNLKATVWPYNNILHKCIDICMINANMDLTDVLNQVLYYIKRQEELNSDYCM